jgi:hypothetical protein
MHRNCPRVGDYGLTASRCVPNIARSLAPPANICGAIAQLGERNTGSVEVGGSIPPGSTNQFVKQEFAVRRLFPLNGGWTGSH